MNFFENYASKITIFAHFSIWIKTDGLKLIRKTYCEIKFLLQLLLEYAYSLILIPECQLIIQI